MKRFEGKNALVTGGANGIGENLVRRLVAEGAKVAVLDIEEAAVHSLCADMPDTTCGLVCDVSNKTAVDAAIAKFVGVFGQIDMLFCNSGIVRFKPFLEIDLENWQHVLNVNLTGVFIVGQAVAKEMIRQGTKGVIVNTSSMLSEHVTAGCGAYAPSKGGVSQLTRLMALELAPYGIRVNAVAPGPTQTRINAAIRQDPEKYSARVVRLADKRFAYPEEITSVMLFLASEEASYVHGAIYMVDSGYTMQ